MSPRTLETGMSIHGEMLLGRNAVKGSGPILDVSNPMTGEKMGPTYHSSSIEDIEQACAFADRAFNTYRSLSLVKRANFLEVIANEIILLGDTLIQRAVAESGLSQTRINSERDRTVGQLQLFADVVRAGHWLDTRLDSAMPERSPLPRPDLRSRHVPLGPVAVFGASNFPLACSVAGGDTASALAAGCPVIAKAHPAQPGTSELLGKAILEASKKCELPNGVFSLLYDNSNQLGEELVAHELIKAVGFTGSRAGGLAFMRVAANRREPIPVFAEMSSINPVFLLPGALKEKPLELSEGFVNSLTMSAGQFCTNPGMVVGIVGDGLNHFIEKTRLALADVPAQTMLTPRIHSAYVRGTSKLSASDVVSEISNGLVSEEPNSCQAKLFTTSAKQFAADHRIHDEVFGASSLIIQCESSKEFIQIAEQLEGQLTATMQLNDTDIELAKSLLPILERKVGRLLCNGFPTGVEVSHAMVHGGPFPATSASQTSSIGSKAIERFLRPICYQNLPSALVPDELEDQNPLGLRRLVNGSYWN